MELNVEVIGKLNVGTAGGWLERMVRRTCVIWSESASYGQTEP
jgi:hypothetical protein